jgi:hypothetical protein
MPQGTAALRLYHDEKDDVLNVAKVVPAAWAGIDRVVAGGL